MMQSLLIFFLTHLVFADVSGGAPCTSDSQCGHGTCNFTMNNGTCVCIPAYANVSCNYQRKQQAVAFGLTWLCVFGVCGIGRLYTEVINGIAPLILGLIGFIPFLIVINYYCCGNISYDRFVNSCICYVMFAMVLVAFVWCIMDLIIFGTLNNAGGPCLDGNGFELLRQF
jgi:TM2 domain-containing membrane protein YozV